jgi:hypothetical protein
VLKKKMRRRQKMAKPKLVKTYKEFMDKTDLIPPKMDKDEAIKYNIWDYLWDEYERGYERKNV